MLVDLHSLAHEDLVEGVEGHYGIPGGYIGEGDESRPRVFHVQEENGRYV